VSLQLPRDPWTRLRRSGNGSRAAELGHWTATQFLVRHGAALQTPSARPERRASARRAIEAILSLDLYPRHKGDLLNICLWKLTEAGGKFGTPYWSRAALAAPRGELQHEHVFQRARMVAALIEGRLTSAAVARRAVGCIVTRDEHRRLSAVSRADPALDGWARYARARVSVVDRRTGRPPRGRGLTIRRS
jgi:hypothetical protein